MRRPKRTILIAGVALTLAAGGTLAANATWSIPGRSAPVALKAADMPSGPKPSISKKDGAAIVTWSPQELAPDVEMQRYVVTRHDADDASSFEAFPATTGTTYTDTGVPAGKFYWTVTPRFEKWIGEEGKKSENVKFSAPAASARTAVVTGASPPGPPTPTATATTKTAGGGSETADPPPAPAVTTGPAPEAGPSSAAPTTPPPTGTPEPAPDANATPGDAGKQ